MWNGSDAHSDRRRKRVGPWCGRCSIFCRREKERSARPATLLTLGCQAVRKRRLKSGMEPRTSVGSCQVRTYVKGDHIDDGGYKTIPDELYDIAKEHWAGGMLVKYGKRPHMEMLHRGTVYVGAAWAYGQPSIGINKKLLVRRDYKDGEVVSDVSEVPAVFEMLDMQASETTRYVLADTDTKYGPSMRIPHQSVRLGAVEDGAGRIHMGHSFSDYGMFCVSRTLSADLIRHFKADSLVIIKQPDTMDMLLRKAIKSDNARRVSVFRNDILCGEVRYFDLSGRYYDKWTIEDEHRLTIFSKPDAHAIEHEYRWAFLPRNETPKMSKLGYQVKLRRQQAILNDVLELVVPTNKTNS